mgnify:CR=1 FL=1|jgi:hypothetical protein
MRPPQASLTFAPPAASRLVNVNRYAGARIDFTAVHFSGPVFAPVAAQSSFQLPHWVRRQLDRSTRLTAAAAPFSKT